MSLDSKRWTPKVKTAIYDSRIKGTKLINEAIAHLKTPPRLLISASTTDYYADSETLSSGGYSCMQSNRQPSQEFSNLITKIFY